MSVPRVLLLTGTPPGTGSVGEIYLRDLCLYYPKKSICCFAVTPPNFGVRPPDLGWLPIVYAHVPRESGIRRFGHHFARVSSFPVQQYVKRVNIPNLIAQAVHFGKKHSVNVVWAVLNRPSIIQMAKAVANALNAQLVTLVWDAPELVMKFLCSDLDRFSYHSLLYKFGKTLQSSARCGVVSEGMQEEYEMRYGVKSVIIRHGIHEVKRRPAAKQPNGGKRFIIGFAGTPNGEWQALFSALSKLNWQIDGRDIVVRWLGARADFQTKERMRIEYFGWRSLEETIDLMSEVDVTYLPYWFDQSYSLAVRLCFPTKLTTYLTSGRPVLYHGPEDSSPTRFFQRFPVGLCCHSLEPSEIIKCLHRFATDREFYAKATAAGQEALDSELNLEVFLQRFATLIGIKENELLPIT